MVASCADTAQPCTSVLVACSVHHCDYLRMLRGVSQVGEPMSLPPMLPGGFENSSKLLHESAQPTWGAPVSTSNGLRLIAPCGDCGMQGGTTPR